jgi:N utilization substance protein B
MAAIEGSAAAGDDRDAGPEGPDAGRDGVPRDGAPRAGRRRQAREMALQMLYQWEQGGSNPQEIIRAFDLYLYGVETASRRLAKGSEEAFALAQTIFRGILPRREEIDQRITERAENWRLERMPIVDRNILRVAVYELLTESDTPRVVIIDEAIELAKKFGSERSGAFVNGLLDALVKHGDLPPVRLK